MFVRVATCTSRSPRCNHAEKYGEILKEALRVVEEKNRIAEDMIDALRSEGIPKDGLPKTARDWLLKNPEHARKIFAVVPDAKLEDHIYR
uniref:Uncharacterized protein n=1 Tax=Candidatus Kentrum sp. TC TaxID=2126339 RepID=A0A450YV72_9GAMM|nr:MAG: hypothetical protein BECKTC1821E_GA0114239_104819 [Candidatus Kentron sp. TC]